MLNWVCSANFSSIYCQASHFSNFPNHCLLLQNLALFTFHLSNVDTQTIRAKVKRERESEKNCCFLAWLNTSAVIIKPLIVEKSCMFFPSFQTLTLFEKQRIMVLLLVYVCTLQEHVNTEHIGFEKMVNVSTLQKPLQFCARYYALQSIYSIQK